MGADDQHAPVARGVQLRGVETGGRITASSPESNRDLRAPGVISGVITASVGCPTAAGSYGASPCYSAHR